MKKNLQRQLIKLLKELHLTMFREYYAECAELSGGAGQEKDK